jgi:Arc/MetJ-type ribon-helix-helix transcriptional regulator
MADTEKITINMSVVDVGKIDLLVQEGFYSNRTDFIRTSIRNQLNGHEDQVQASVTKHSFVMGVMTIDRKEIERLAAANEKLSARVLGLLEIRPDVDPALADKVVDRLVVRGVVRASDAVKSVLGDRIS